MFETVGDAAETIDFLMSQYGGCEGPLVYPVLRRDGENIGYVQAVPLGDGVWEIGYHIGARYTGHGYATEAVKAFLPVIMERIGISEMAGVCLAENIASLKVMEKCGFILKFKGIDDYQGERREICRYLYQG